MQILIDKTGMELSISNNRLAMTLSGKEKYLPPGRISALHIMAPCTTSTAVLAWAAEYEIPVLIYNRAGRVMARIWQPGFGSHAAIRQMQLDYCRSGEAIIWMKELLVKKTSHQLQTLRQLPAALRHAAITDRVEKLHGMLLADSGLNSQWLRTLEAGAGRWYWAGVAYALREKIKLHPRKVRPAKDRFNALLNYLYGTLYGLVEGCILAAGLDPHISIMHRMEYNTPAFSFDLIEPFRHWADDFLIQLVLHEGLPPGSTEEQTGTVVLTSKGKKEILGRWFQYLELKTASPRKLVRRKDQVQQLCSSLASMLLKKYKQQQKKHTS